MIEAALACGMHPEDYLGKSHRWHGVLCAHLDAKWNKPEKADWYQAQVAFEVFRSARESTGQLSVKDFLLEFKSVVPDGDTREVSVEQRSLEGKAAWAWLGGQRMGGQT